MIRLLFMAFCQSATLAMGQVMLKFGLQRMEPFGWNLSFWKSVFWNWQFALCGVCMAVQTLLWMYIIKHFPLSMAYPLGSLSYVFTMLAAIVFFHEDVGMMKWLGVMLIMTGCYLLTK